MSRGNLRLQANASGSEVACEPHDAAQVRHRCPDDIDTRVRIVDPVDRNLVDPQSGPFREHEQFGIEKSGAIAYERQKLPRPVSPDRLEATLSIREARPQLEVEQSVVTP